MNELPRYRLAHSFVDFKSELNRLLMLGQYRASRDQNYHDHLQDGGHLEGQSRDRFDDLNLAEETNDWYEIAKTEAPKPDNLEPLKSVPEGNVLRLRESFQNEAHFKEQHALEMRQREEQQEMFVRIDQSRRSTLNMDAVVVKEEREEVEEVAQEAEFMENVPCIPNDYMHTPDAPDIQRPSKQQQQHHHQQQQQQQQNQEQQQKFEQQQDKEQRQHQQQHHEHQLMSTKPKIQLPQKPLHSQQTKQQTQQLLEMAKNKEREIFKEMTDRQTNDMLMLTCNKPLNELPPPCPPRGRKAEQLNRERIAFVDARVEQIASYEPKSFTELVYQLTDQCRNDLEKVRAIFKWITLKDLNQVCFKYELNADSPYFFLKGIKYGLESYHELFRRLCSYAGIPVHIIRGLSKSAGYQPGTPLTNEKFRNIWCAAFVDENWRFIDCHWGARHVNKSRVKTTKQTNGVFCYSLDEFFFITDPVDLIYMHFPDDPKWQLLEKSIDKTTFLSYPVVKSTFFYYGLRFTRNSRSVLETDNGLLDVMLKKSGNFDLVFNTRIEYTGENLHGHCIYQNVDAGVVFHVNIPFSGEYIFTIFASQRGATEVFSNVCSFKLQSSCDIMERNIPSRFPLLTDGYGVLPVAKDYGIETQSHRGFYLVTDKEKMILNIGFACSLVVSQKYFKGGESGENSDIELNRHYFQRYRDHRHVSYLLRFPAPGFYVFSLFATKRGSGTQQLECACRYVIHCTSQADHMIKIYPKVLQHWIRCRLYEPTHGDLRVNKNVKFKLEVYNATAVAVIVNQQWFYLKQGESTEDKAKNIWIGVAHTGNNPKHKLEVYARFKGNNKDFFPLLEYRLIEDN